MTATIWKFPFEIGDEVSIQMPEGSHVLDVQMQGEVPCIWALVNPENPLEPRTFLVRGTGHNAEGIDGALHVGTFQMMFGAIVLHVFEEAPG
jgi:hypothetical protein